MGLFELALSIVVVDNQNDEDYGKEVGPLKADPFGPLEGGQGGKLQEYNFLEEGVYGLVELEGLELELLWVGLVGVEEREGHLCEEGQEEEEEEVGEGVL